MKRLNQILLVVVLAAVTSCSKSEDPTPSVTPVDPSTVAAISGQFQKRVLIEDYTGTWCGWCPRVAYGIQKVEELGIRAVPVAIHNGDPMAWGTSSTWPQSVNSFPTAMLNRLTLWSYPENTNTKQVKYLNGNNCELGLAMNSTVSGGNINLDVKVKFAKDYTGLKLVVYVLEDNLVYNQTNYTSGLYGSGNVNPIVNFDHDHVLRACLTNIQGDAILGTTTNGQTVTKNFSVPVPGNIFNVANMNFVAFVVDSNGSTINTRAANQNDNQSFEQNP
jgi:hypothetical protein